MKRLVRIMIAAALAFGWHADAKTLKVHYNRFSGNYDNWNLWTWNATDSADGTDVASSGRDDFGLVFEIDTDKLQLSDKKIGMLPRLGKWVDKDAPDRFYEPTMPKEVYIFEGDPGVYTNPPEVVPEIKAAYLDGENKIRVVLNSTLAWNYFTKHPISVTFANTPVKVSGFEFLPKKENGRVIVLTLDKKLSGDILGEVNAGNCAVAIEGLGKRSIYPGRILDSEYFYADKELGAFEENDTWIVRVFSPASTAVALLLADKTSSSAVRELPMANTGNGLWEAHVNENIAGQYYKIKTTRNGRTVEGIDPYSRANTGHDGWGIIFKDTTPVSDAPVFDNSQDIIYEIHLRDMTIDEFSGVKHKGKYLGLAETGTKNPQFPEIATGLAHLKELGVNTVHIMPVQDFENDESSSTYGWGYMPVHFNSPDGWYASKTEDASRVAELKTLIDTLHKNGMKVVMDVVYNHTAEGGPNVTFGFNALAENYYYRTKDDGSYWNGSGCGNEFRSESKMGRKFIVDSLKYWVKEYKVDGFRFDLMGLIDIDTVEQAIAELKKTNPDIFIYGEPWTAGETPIEKITKGSQRGKNFSVFNDDFRNAVKGSVFDLKPGYVQAGLYRKEVVSGIRGSIDAFAASPLESINYVSCHDNHTLFDRIDRTEDMKATPEEKTKMTMLANGIILTSQGIPFLHAGEEFLRTK
ncbi:MAG: alpha-amylase family glycosyl hydrolase, partial [Elusimicrobiaceae bacterium]